MRPGSWALGPQVSHSPLWALRFSSVKWEYSLLPSELLRELKEVAHVGASAVSGPQLAQKLRLSICRACSVTAA